MASHEFAHGLVLTRNRRLNDVIGNWLFSGPGGNALGVYRPRHFAHHRLCSTRDDTKTLYKWNYAGAMLVIELLRSLSGWDYLEQVLAVLRSGRENASRESLPLRALVPFICSQLIIALVLCYISPLVYFALWLTPLLSANMLFSKLRSSVEHLPVGESRPLQEDSPYYRGTDGPFVRTVRASLVARLFLCKLNFCYHAEHHLWPDISYQYLPVLHRRLLAQLPAGRSSDWNVEASYLATLIRFWKDA